VVAVALTQLRFSVAEVNLVAVVEEINVLYKDRFRVEAQML
jgi:hypothetical protein